MTADVLPFPQPNREDEHWMAAADALRALSHAGDLVRADLEVSRAAMSKLDASMPPLSDKDRDNLLEVFGSESAAFAVVMTGLADKTDDACLPAITSLLHKAANLDTTGK